MKKVYSSQLEIYIGTTVCLAIIPTEESAGLEVTTESTHSRSWQERTFSPRAIFQLSKLSTTTLTTLTCSWLESWRRDTRTPYWAPSSPASWATSSSVWRRETDSTTRMETSPPGSLCPSWTPSEKWAWRGCKCSTCTGPSSGSVRECLVYWIIESSFPLHLYKLSCTSVFWLSHPLNFASCCNEDPTYSLQSVWQHGRGGDPATGVQDGRPDRQQAHSLFWCSQHSATGSQRLQRFVGFSRINTQTCNHPLGYNKI